MTSRLALVSAVFVVVTSACAPQKAGDSCDANADDDPCPEGLVCQEDGDGGVCLVPLGGDCSGDAEDFCADDAACADDVCGGRGADCELDSQCDDRLVCAELASGGQSCQPPVRVEGQVIDGLDQGAIEGADVIGVDVDGAGISRTATTGADGRYSLVINLKRNDDGSPTAATVTLRAAASDYAAFPGGLRAAIPVDIDAAVEGDSGFVVENAATTIALLPLPAARQGRPILSGDVDANGGVLVVATNGAEASSTLTDSDGTFRIFNVAPGSVTVSGYIAGLQFVPVTVTVGDDDVGDVSLARDGTATATVSGSVQVVNGGGGSVTSIVFVVADTFDVVLQRGDVPVGLRAANVAGAFSIAGVPDGVYVVLAAFENDLLVRDPDENIGGTELVTVTVAGSDVVIGQSFKITGALAVVSPGADGIETITDPSPDFIFGNDSSEDGYDVVVIDALGVVNWQTELPSQNGSGDITLPYGGPGLVDGMIYQLRVKSFRGDGADRSSISATEDLKGIFLFQP